MSVRTTRKRCTIKGLNGEDVSIDLLHVGFELDANSWEEFSQRVHRRYKANNKNSMVLRLLINAYVNGFVDLDNIEEKLDNIKDKLIYVGGRFS